MKKKNLWITILLIILSLCFTIGLTACDDGDNGGNGGEKTITISIESNVEIGTSVVLEKEASFQPFLQDNIKYEFIGENTCNATFSHSLKNNWWTTSVSATAPGTVSIKISYMEGENIVAESNVVTVTFYANTISTVDELKAIANTSKSYILEADIDLSSESNWTPIEGFTGILNGGGYKIFNLTVNSTNTENIGLFGTLNGTVTNLSIENAQITSKGDAGKAGIVAGTNCGTIKNVVVEGTINPKFYNNVGGIAGYSSGGTISECVNKATVIGANNVGGIVGYAEISDSTHLQDCQNLGAIEGKEVVGGIGGYITTQKKEGTYLLQRHENSNTVTGKEKIGGIFGCVSGISYSSYPTRYTNFEISVSENKAEIIGSGDYVGGIVGYGSRLNTIISCENTADITGGNYVGGLVGYSSNTNIKANESENNNTITGKGYVGGFAGYVGLVEYAINNGTITSTGVIVEDGNSNAYIGGIAGYCTGMIGCVNNSDIVITTSGSYTGGLAGYVRLSGYEYFCENKNYGAVTAKNYVGGIVGYLTTNNSEGTYYIQDNENNGVIKGESYVGGISGAIYGVSYSSYPTRYTYFEISVVTNNADIIATGDYIGGFTGYATRLSSVTTSENKADVTGGNYVGGMLGYAPSTHIRATGISNENKITGKGYVGGFAGYTGIVEDAINNGVIESTGIIVEDSIAKSYVGGIAGYCTGLIGCTNNSDISITHNGQFVGGLAGYINMSNKDCLNDNENNGVIKGGDYTAGIVGYITTPQSEGNYAITNNRNNNSVTGSSYVGGIIGYAKGISYSSYPTRYTNIEVTYCTNNGEITGSGYVGGIVGGYARLTTDSNLMDTNTTLYGEKLGQ